ncbi:hypothetical protein EJB05_48427, partial [Eragrostis curvula]
MHNVGKAEGRRLMEPAAALAALLLLLPPYGGAASSEGLFGQFGQFALSSMKLRVKLQKKLVEKLQEKLFYQTISDTATDTATTVVFERSQSHNRSWHSRSPNKQALNQIPCRQSFNLTCDNSYWPPKLFLGDGTVEVLEISAPSSTVSINSSFVKFTDGTTMMAALRMEHAEAASPKAARSSCRPIWRIAWRW